ncbi:lytic murein transglycosylase [Haemophilus paracuniculus]|uniref:Lytic murein transglycosylase n=1 Tax=Haemophilus paracuniculus TaxID=734 RepID=A0A1T0AV76_9PAST|nr:transglycosylase SLT domain-containing protein [Haemophilus paracuniculus]OOS00619.1 lytic murein transglycosylase [Haemophilus paracuniculus]
MWKKTLLALLVASPLLWANENPPASTATEKTFSQSEVDQLQGKWKSDQEKEAQHLIAQRNLFLEVESLLNGITSQAKISPEMLQLSSKLIDLLGDYPLREEAEWSLLNAKLSKGQASEADIQAFQQRYPNSAYQKTLAQRPFEQLYSQKKYGELLDYAKQVAPQGADNQCRMFSAQYQQLANKLNGSADNAKEKAVQSQTAFLLKDLFGQFEGFWSKTLAVPEICQDIEKAWQADGGKTNEQIQQKAVALFAKNNGKALAELAKGSEVAGWINSLEKLLAEPQNLPKFLEILPLAEQNKTAEQLQTIELNKPVVVQAFPAFVKTLPEQLENPDFAVYQQWADQLQLSPEQVREWKIAFLNRLFDNQNPTFQTWRDNQIAELKADNLTERRLRLAILQQEPLSQWLDLLSNEGKTKLEWRYWAAKSEKNAKKREQQLQALMGERGFYPMLAADSLGKPYQLSEPEFKGLTDEQKQQFAPQLAKITEWKALERHSQAKTAWVNWLKTLSFDEQIALADYAKQQDWYDLAVESTILAKAWDYLSLRLPNAYSQWYDLHLADKPISKSFAMAIARQESAWDAQARSSANALGLMQMLPSTAEKTAKDNSLPFAGENDLFDPFKNIMLGVTHLTELNQKYPSNRALIAAAYNAGAGRVEKWLERSQGKLAMDEFIASIPFYETRGYVQNVIAYDYYYQLLQKVKEPIMFNQAEKVRKY